MSKKLEAVKTLLSELSDAERDEIGHALFTANVPKKEEMLKCEGGYYLWGDGRASRREQSDAHNKIGNCFTTRYEAIAYSKLKQPLDIINHHMRRLNKKDGFVPDWSDVSQGKFYIVHSAASKEYVIHSWYVTQLLGNEVCSRESAKYLEDKLNKGLVAGIDKPEGA